MGIIFFRHENIFSLYLKSELVEEVVDEVFNAADDAVVQMLACDVVENDPGRWRRQFVPHPVVLLMAVDGHLERQQSQHQQVVLRREKRVLTCRERARNGVPTAHPEVVQQVVGLHQAHPVRWFHRFFIQRRSLQFHLLLAGVI